MAQLGQAFNTEDLPQGNGGDFQPLPAGWYSARIANAELKTTKAGTGQFIAVRYDITGPSHEGRVVFANLNISNPNPKAEEIGRQKLGDLMRAIGLQRVTDTDQLLGGVCQIKLKIQKSEEYGDRNEVTGWKAMEGSAPPSGMPKTQDKPSGAGAPPWAK